jgi:Cupin domain
MQRLVVTGETEQGKARIVSDRKVEPVTAAAMPGAAFYRLWGSDSMPTLPESGETPTYTNLFPPPGGFRLAVLSLGPDQEATMPADFDATAAMAEFNEKLPGAAAAMDFANPGMHQTDTVDLGVVLTGEVWLDLGDGQETHLRAGDFAVQNGTRHAWRNKSTERCTLAFTLIGVERRR